MPDDPKHYLEQYDNGSPTNFTNDEITEEQLPELMELVGNIIFLFNSVEALLDQLIANIINERSHQPGYAVVSELNSVFTKKILVFKALYGPMVEYIKNDDLSKKFEALYTRLFKVKDIRNDITHADWMSASNTYEVRLRISTDEGGAYAIRKVMSPEFLKAQITELEAIVEGLDDFEECKDDAVVSHDRKIRTQTSTD